MKWMPIHITVDNVDHVDKGCCDIRLVLKWSQKLMKEKAIESY